MNEDPFYRYATPPLVVKFEGQGNGVKTFILNNDEISKLINRPPLYFVKYCGYELGTPVNFKLKRYSINGTHDSEKINILFKEYMNRFVNCKTCNNPETDYFVKNNSIQLHCNACGKISTFNMEHKLEKFILKDLQTTSKKRKPYSIQTFTDDVIIDTVFKDDDDWCDDNDDDIKVRLQELPSSVRYLTIDSNYPKSRNDRISIMYDFIRQKLKYNDVLNINTEVVNEAKRLCLLNRIPFILGDLLFNKSVLSDLLLHESLFYIVTYKNKSSQKYFFKIIIDKCIELKNEHELSDTLIYLIHKNMMCISIIKRYMHKKFDKGIIAELEKTIDIIENEDSEKIIFSKEHIQPILYNPQDVDVDPTYINSI